MRYFNEAFVPKPILDVEFRCEVLNIMLLIYEG